MADQEERSAQVRATLLSAGTAVDLIGRAGNGPNGPTYDGAVAAIEHLWGRLKPQERKELCAILAAKLYVAQHSIDADAQLAMGQIERIVDGYRERNARRETDR